MINLQLMQLSDDFIIQNEHDLSIIIRETKYYNDKLDLKQDIKLIQRLLIMKSK